MPIYVRSPCSLGYHRRLVPLTLAELDGAVLCGPDGDTSARLLPLLLARNDLSHVCYAFRAVSPAERDRMVATHEVLAATCFDATLKFAMRMRGYDSSDIEFLYFADHGLDILFERSHLPRHRFGGEAGDSPQTLHSIVRTAWEDCAVIRISARVQCSTAILRLTRTSCVNSWNGSSHAQVFPPAQPPFLFMRDSLRWQYTIHVAQFGATGRWDLKPVSATLAETVVGYRGDNGQSR